MDDKALFIPKIKEIIAPYVENQENFENISLDTDFIQDLDINSANLVDIILDVEDAYQIEIDNDAMNRMTTVGASIEVIQEKKK
ncbi:phosphopantetheine-binding protein [Aquimarina sp. ERC-38]|uniref:acyl carrier protein n=1 Tax=Aquimarina sp. ERC-38 TaxID=2949996 RepID=UPI002247CD7A|nr:phosphopantetheine-binding protein [Aquimarina sp. ERC-38]UZO80127.1 phosphopantetheine-binding protein [Aquimarina sp. ERC-38]